jgi:folate-binding protein YgfZ
MAWQRGVTLPSEATLDHLNAISYSKGCYLGQELVRCDRRVRVRVTR